MKLYQAKPKLLFLYTELSGYFIACLKKLSELHDVEIYVFHWPVNKEAPFDFEFSGNVKFFEKRAFSKQELSEKIKTVHMIWAQCKSIRSGYLR